MKQLSDAMLYGSDLAYIHHVGYGGFATAVAPAVGQLLAAAGIGDGLVVDLGCGSGILARELTALGYRVLGVDVSAHMVDRARRVAPRARFVQGSLRRVALPSCRAVVAIGESISYAGSSERQAPALGHLFTRVARALEPGGLFLFDVIGAGGAPMVYRTWQSGSGWAVLVDVKERPEARVVTRRITTFRARGATYRRTDECHRVGVYDRADVVRRLRAAGLSASVRRHYGRAAVPPRRLVFVARRSRGGDSRGTG
jgi:SAM-dependent methyltransferase